MFIGGADPASSPPELRVPSIKGALRFWWRALSYGRVGNDIKQLAQEEAALFGSADSEVGQSKVLLSARVLGDPESLSKGAVLKDGNGVVGEGARYLGYGLMEAFESAKKGTKAGQLNRPCLLAPFDFELDALFHPRLNSEAKTQVIAALKIMGLLGGLGSRSRRGYGSISLLSLTQNGNEIWRAPEDVAGLQKELAGFLTGARGGLPSYTALSARTRIVLIDGSTSDSALKLLSRLGRDFVFYRSWGRSQGNGTSKVLEALSERNFEDDHNMSKGTRAIQQPPRRAAFGLPHNYGKEDWQSVFGSEHDRRASPLFFHIHQTGAKPVGVLAFLPAVFLPNGEQVQAFGRSVPQRPDPAIWEPVANFLDRIKDPNQGKVSFSKVVEVRP
jgi:CRISPR-associated protein Cmr1